MNAPRFAVVDELCPTIGAQELATRYGVHGKTPARWCKAGLMGPEGELWFRTPGGHLRFWLDKLEAKEQEGWKAA